MTAPPCGNYGDVTGDGTITITDAMYISQYVAGSRTLTSDQLIRANVKGYGNVSELDATLLANYVGGAITTFPVCSDTPPMSTMSIDPGHVASLNIPTGATLEVDGVEVI